MKRSKRNCTFCDYEFRIVLKIFFNEKKDKEIKFHYTFNGDNNIVVRIIVNNMYFKQKYAFCLLAQLNAFSCAIPIVM